MNEETKKALELAREVLEQSDPKWDERIRAMSAIDAALATAAPAAHEPPRDQRNQPRQQ